MGSECFAIVRGSAIRVTELDSRGRVSDPIRYATSKAVAKVTINEVTDAGGNEMLRNDTDKRRIHLIRNTLTLRHTVDVQFLRVDPGILSLVAGTPPVTNANGDFVGFDEGSRVPATSFALEVWSKLEGSRCDDGRRNWGYTAFPHLRGGYLSGFRFTNGLVSFTLTRARTRRITSWGVGPYDLTGPFERLIGAVSRNTSYRMFAAPIEPPVQMDGVFETEDVISNGDAYDPMPDPTAPLVLNGGTAEDAGPYTISGGGA